MSAIFNVVTDHGDYTLIAADFDDAFACIKFLARKDAAALRDVDEVLSVTRIADLPMVSPRLGLRPEACYGEGKDGVQVLTIRPDDAPDAFQA